MAEQRIEAIRNHLRTAYLMSEEKIDAMLPRYLASLQEMMGKLERAVRSGSLAETGRAGHALKGALLNLGLQDLAQKAYAIELAGKAGGNESECSRLVFELKEELTGLT